MEKAHQVLHDIFGHSSFRLAQELVVHRLLVDNDNALVLFPTGGGKSLTYQVPALCLDGLTLVISPLIALMKDQVDYLVGLGVKAASLDSSLTGDRAAWVKQEVMSGQMKILYVAPERLNNEGFVAMMSRVKISLLAVDESHCISQWGASFRPEYLKVARFAEEMDVERVLCLTATATQNVCNDICRQFLIDPTDGVIRSPMFRPNLQFRVQVAADLNEKVAKIVPMLEARTGPAIIYVTLQRHATEVADKLRVHGLQPLVYHAGLASEERRRVQEEFMDSDDAVVCATIAFGMGIDKANIRQVIHLYMPKTIEGYSQEVGRAGRDGLRSTCLMILSAPDIPILEGFCRGDTCSKKDLQRWLEEVASKVPDVDGTIFFNLYTQAKECSNVLGLSYASLELDYGFIRAVTPFYAVYDITLRGGDFNKVLLDNSAAAKAVRGAWVAKAGGYQIDMVNAAATSGIDRGVMAKLINTWELDGLVTVKASQVRNPLPKNAAEVERLASEMHAKMVDREEEAIKKLRQVIEVATAEECLAYAIAEYFGDAAAVPEGLCGMCTFCTTGESVTFDSVAKTKTDPKKVKAVLEACPDRDDPRMLARMAFGITSPRLAYQKLSTGHPLFGCMDDVDFNSLVTAFEKECAAAQYERGYASNEAGGGKRSEAGGRSGVRSGWPSGLKRVTERS
ncbi:ATP-dependent DNA helicase [Punctularia strigosozonata HHB-11173 SS5]|uniref:ATP-dependent DNA helicase n=1 Tax=Punctularia strigosozonata (strain HHB-11173) TaxID=741275 RepID=UPI0004418577|nr:ATP-dependent DNA helicase [Punctularia strigosozonata HHB-11173 SS5]EIN14131.1 ATP-dependent DNA helicase [Punctularia strigosozonata HHB-11173 SS5]